MNKLSKLRKLFKEHYIDGYLIPKNDEFFGEYVDKRDDRLNYISSFSGSSGQAIILKKKAYLFVDGRYTLQAKKEVNKNFKVIEIHKIKPYKILEKISTKIKIGFDPKLFSEFSLLNNFKTKNTILIPINNNLIDKIWLKRPKAKTNKFFILNSKQTGKGYKVKINEVCNILKKIKIDKLLITAPENLAWVLNIRGNDSKYSPLPNCHGVIGVDKKINLIVDKNKIGKKFKLFFKKNVNYTDPSKILDYFDNLDSKNSLLIDKMTCPYYYKKMIERKFKSKEVIDPIFYLKSKKNNTEIKNTIKSHIADGVALTRFIYWIKKNVKKNKITEVDAEKKLEKFRKKNNTYQFPSFNTISGTGPNGAIVHYRANSKSNRLIKKNDIYLCDSGGQYHYGTTDVTRTICFENQSSKIKNIYTKVLKGHIGVVTYNLNKYTTGKQLDVIARAPLKKIGLDYAHGTGHGVGYFLNVHEGPQAISKFNNVKLEPGMIISNEPGYYAANKFGIRIENLIYIKKLRQKIEFENLTLAPIERDLINYKLLNKLEKRYLEKYHKRTYLLLSPFLNKNEKTWLKSFFS